MFWGASQYVHFNQKITNELHQILAPGSYAPEKVNQEHTYAYSFGMKPELKVKNDTPGKNLIYFFFGLFKNVDKNVDISTKKTVVALNFKILFLSINDSKCRFFEMKKKTFLRFLQLRVSK